ncbi:baseplate protein [Clostridium botulinum]|nr:baseplate protein [Clostridium botulinum]NFI47459.1 baseplate protein [Clostridium botulinum]NFJ91435.1 baseplate protein [Clostridium botulinum]
MLSRALLKEQQIIQLNLKYVNGNKTKKFLYKINIVLDLSK